MSETEWLACEDPQAMLANLGDDYSPRKLRLFAVACCRLVWPDNTHPDGRAAVGVAERFADGLAAEDELGAASRAAAGAVYCAADHAAHRAAHRAAKWAAGRAAHWAAYRAVHWAARWAADSAADWAAHQPGQRKAQADLIRSIAGNPWRPVTLPPGWLTPDVLSLAGAAYAERLDDFTLDPARLAVLSDALEEAGCAGVCPVCDGKRRVKVWDKPPDIEAWHKCGYEMPRGCGGSGFATHPLLAALRSPGPHYRGFWALDIVLGKP